MKIVINYDLMEKIAEAKYGFSLKRECKIVSATVAVCYSFFSVLNCVAMNSIDFQRWLVSLPFYAIYSIVLATGLSSLIRGVSGQKEMATIHLDDLSIDLNSLNIDTDVDLLLEAYKYYTEYECDHDKIIPTLIQKKYINIPTTDDEEVSIVQKHMIGSSVYTLSKGRKVKQMVGKLATNHM